MKMLYVTDHGVVSDSHLVQTQAIQSAIEQENYDIYRAILYG